MNGSANTYSYDTVKNASYGFLASGTVDDKFAHNTLTSNQYGAFEQFAQHSTWTANNFSSNTVRGYQTDADTGSTILTGNTASHNGGIGFYLNCSNGSNAVVKYNTANYNGGGGIASNYCSVGNVFSTFTSNKTNHNVGAGIASTSDVNAKFNLNTANANTIYGFSFALPNGCVVTKNVSNGNGSDGVSFYTNNTYFPSLVSYNSSSSNGGYGYNADALVNGSNDSGSANIAGLFNNVSG